MRRNGPPESMSFEDLPDGPVPPGAVRVAVQASAVNFFDSLVVAGTYQQKPELPFVPGAEVAGTVVAAPAESGFVPGDRVLAQVRWSGINGGGYAEVAHTRPQDTLKIPVSMSFEEAAAFYINYQTGWFGLHRRAHLQAGDFLLVHAAAGGVGTAALQLGKAAGAIVIASVGSPEKAEVCRRLGADLVIERHEQDLVQAVREFTQGHGADVVFDPVGGEAYERSTKCIAFEGRLVVVGFTSGEIPQARQPRARQELFGGGPPLEPLPGAEARPRCRMHRRAVEAVRRRPHRALRVAQGAPRAGGAGACRRRGGSDHRQDGPGDGG